jgi:kynurenine formamidase
LHDLDYVGLDDLGDYPNPWPGRIEPREDQGKTQRATRLFPFRLIDPTGRAFGNDMYLEYGHGTGTHIEGAFFDPWGRHGVPDEILRRYVRMPADRLVGEACLLDLSESIGPLQQIDYMHLRNVDPGLKSGDICVLRADITDWYFYGAAPGKTPGLSPDAARWLVDKGIRALVLDFAVEKSDPVSANPAIKYTPNKIHYFLHKNDIPIVEWAVNMKNLRKNRFMMAMCALQASHQGGFPAQIFAVEKW